MRACPVRTGGRCSYTKRLHPVSTVGAPVSGANGRLALKSSSIPVRTGGGAPTGTPDPLPGIEPQRRILIVGAPVSGANGAGSEVWFDSGSHRGGAPTGTPDPIPGIEPQRRILIVGAPAPGANGGPAGHSL